jgi:hypothetical protein
LPKLGRAHARNTSITPNDAALPSANSAAVPSIRAFMQWSAAIAAVGFLPANTPLK